MLQDDEEVLERHEIRVEHATIFHGGVDQLLDDQFAQIDEVRALHLRRIALCSKQKLYYLLTDRFHGEKT